MRRGLTALSLIAMALGLQALACRWVWFGADRDVRAVKIPDGGVIVLRNRDHPRNTGVLEALSRLIEHDRSFWAHVEDEPDPANPGASEDLIAVNESISDSIARHDDALRDANEQVSNRINALAGKYGLEERSPLIGEESQPPHPP